MIEAEKLFAEYLKNQEIKDKAAGISWAYLTDWDKHLIKTSFMAALELVQEKNKELVEQKNK